MRNHKRNAVKEVRKSEFFPSKVHPFTLRSKKKSTIELSPSKVPPFTLRSQKSAERNYISPDTRGHCEQKPSRLADCLRTEIDGQFINYSPLFLSRQPSIKSEDSSFKTVNDPASRRLIGQREK